MSQQSSMQFDSFKGQDSVYYREQQQESLKEQQLQYQRELARQGEFYKRERSLFSPESSGAPPQGQSPFQPAMSPASQKIVKRMRQKERTIKQKEAKALFVKL